MYERVPQSLKDHALFCLWKYESRKGKPTKVPYQVSGFRADTGNRACFTNFATAVAQRDAYDGIGVGLFDDLAAIDIDDCITDGVPSPMAQDIVDSVDSYTEISPSGKGIRIIAKAKGLRYDTARYYINNRAQHLEVYVAGMTTKFLTLTGNCIRERDVEERGQQIRGVVEKYMRRQQTMQSRASPPPGSYLSDDTVIQKALASKQGEKFRRLWEGNIEGYPSRSEAELALLTILAFWCGGDREQMDRLFQRSGLMREKWYREDYREKTLTMAITRTSEFYKPMAVSSAQVDFNEIVPVLEKLDAIHNPRYSDKDIGAGRLFADVFRSKARFIPERKKWAVYDGKRWVTDIAGLLVAELGKDLSDALMIYASGLHDEDDRKTVLKWCGKWVQRRFRDIYIKEAQSVYQLPTAQLDRDPYLFNCNNCTVDLRTREAYEHRPEDFITKISPVDYLPAARSERWDRFIDEIMSGDREKASFLQQALAYGLSGDTRHECMFIL